MTDRLRDNLRHEAAAVMQVDLLDRVRVGSARAARRRALAFAIGVFILVVALAGTSLARRNQAAPSPVGTPGPVTASPSVGPLPVLDPSPPPADLWTSANDPLPDTSLDSVPLVVPEWPGAHPDQSCGGNVVLSRGVYHFSRGAFRQLRLVKAVPDGLAGVVALFYCELGQVGRQFQVVSYERDAAGVLGLRGVVVATSPGGVAALFDVAVAGPEVRVEVGDWGSGATIGEDSHYSVHQWRAYAWQGSGVVQVGGPTTFGPNPNMYLLRVHLADQHVPLTALQAGRRTVTPRVSVVNDGTSRAVHATVTITVPDGFGLTDVVGPVCSADTWQARSVSGGRQFWCDQGTLAPHSTVVLSPTFTVTGARLADYTAPPGGHTFGRVSVVASGVSLAGQTGVDTDLTFFIDY